MGISTSIASFYNSVIAANIIAALYTYNMTMGYANDLIVAVNLWNVYDMQMKTIEV